MDLFTAILKIVYIIFTIGLSVIGFNVLMLTILFLLHKEDPQPAIKESITDYPPVLIQLPLFNERFVVRRLLTAIAGLDYPLDRLEIQVLDDSTDDTTSIIEETIAQLAGAGLLIKHLRRGSRHGYKAGALAYGLGLSDAPIIVVFDADFAPDPDFLKQVVPVLLADDKIGMVQTRWSHLNRDQSMLTRAQALALDAHFVVEQTARQRSGLFMNFSGTAGIWRRECIEDAGGWHEDTLSEDIDLSYRAQLLGWKFIYLPEVSVNAEIPSLMMGFKRQQTRWATGTVQVLRKLTHRVLTANIPLIKKIQGMIHLGGYVVHPLMLGILLLSLPLMLVDGLHMFQLAFLGLAMIGSPLEVLVSQRWLGGSWLIRLLVYPVFMFFGMGIIVSNTEAFFRGLSGRQQEFKRTPKFSTAANESQESAGQYMIRWDLTTVMELLLMIYAIISAVISISKAPALAPFLILYALGTGYVALTTIYQTLSHRRAASRLDTSASLS